MKLAIIGSPNTFPTTEKLGLGYHLVLSQYCNDPTYAGYYLDKALAGHFIMVDNGAAELGQSIPFDAVVDVANMLGADEIAMPDALDKSHETLSLTSSALEKVPALSRIMIPQGETWDEWSFCAETMLRWGCGTIAVAKRYERLPGGRKHAVSLLAGMSGIANVHIHFLGCFQDPIKEIYEARSATLPVRGIDTAAPFAYSQHGIAIDSGQHASYKWGEPFVPGYALQYGTELMFACGGPRAHNNN